MRRHPGGRYGIGTVASVVLIGVAVETSFRLLHMDRVGRPSPAQEVDVTPVQA